MSTVEVCHFGVEKDGVDLLDTEFGLALHVPSKGLVVYTLNAEAPGEAEYQTADSLEDLAYKLAALVSRDELEQRLADAERDVAEAEERIKQDEEILEWCHVNKDECVSKYSTYYCWPEDTEDECHSKIIEHFEKDLSIEKERIFSLQKKRGVLAEALRGDADVDVIFECWPSGRWQEKTTYKFKAKILHR
ncbi:MAG: hypothetical protein ABWK01_01515 [Infirmifilum sp.]